MERSERALVSVSISIILKRIQTDLISAGEIDVIDVSFFR